MEEFLQKGKVVSQRATSKGVTLPKRATLEYDGEKHDAAIQSVDISKESFETARGMEQNFRDFWGYNVAGYELSKIVQLNMVPPHVERKMGGQAAAFSWWVDDTMMELDRLKKKIEPPDQDAWNKQMYAARVFHELIYDTDPNLTNALITKDWQVWIIDFTRAFRLMKDIAQIKSLVQCDRKLLANIRSLDKGILKAKLSRWLSLREIDGVMARSVKITEFFDHQVKAKGEAAVLYDFPRTSQACGTGL